MKNFKDFAENNKNINFNYKIAKLSSLGVGGKVHYFFKANSIDLLKKAIGLSYLEKIPVFVIGDGTNILFNDGFLDIFLIKLGNYFKKIEIFQNGEIKVGAAYNLGKLIVKAARGGIDFSFLAGIPGTVGGAVKGNSGTRDKSICEYLRKIEYVSVGGKLLEMDVKKEMYSYRKLLIPGIAAIVSATFNGNRKDKKIIFKSIREKIKQKKKSQPLNKKSAGCFFKNPDGNFAGKLIDESGLKGFSFGGAAVSEKHANFLINYENASAEEIFVLSLIINEKVKEKFGIDLKNEVKMIGFTR